ncbi:hypothetical protein [uncultured Paraglaciecola sp.]|uniref:hypothetical protein n=1 Tax=uncultured Paraglaciecola sp. TaxID=1765024 RepID=UPI0025E0B391|nr:hypothetical protein [uncultured Paraglaciecola sp.]
MFTTASSANQEELDGLAFASVSVIETLTMMWLLSRINLTGVKLTCVAILFFHGTKVFMMMIEAAFFLNIWTTTPLMSLAEINAMELQGLVMALLYCPVLVWSMGKWGDKKSNAASLAFPQRSALGNLTTLTKRLLVVSVVYATCYILAGMFILIPLAGESFQPTYEHLQVPVWMPLFQVARGVLWGLILLPIVIHFSGTKRQLRISVGLGLAALGSAQLLYPNPHMNEALRYAHIVDITVSMFVFGWIACWIFALRK